MNKALKFAKSHLSWEQSSSCCGLRAVMRAFLGEDRNPTNRFSMTRFRAI